MRYAVFSDVHSNLEALDAVLDAYKSEAIDKYFCAGDIIGYAASPKECVERIRKIAAVTVAGNHDWAVIGLFPVRYFNPIAREAISFSSRGLDEKDINFLQSLKLIYKNEELTLVHGTLERPEEFQYMNDAYIAWESFLLLENNLCFLGHSHSAGIFIRDKDDRIAYLEDSSIDIEEGKSYIINVGSVGQPRDGDPRACYCIYDTEKKVVEVKRIAYDLETARKKIIAAGLPAALGNRLLTGR